MMRGGEEEGERVVVEIMEDEEPKETVYRTILFWVYHSSRSYMFISAQTSNHLAWAMS